MMSLLWEAIIGLIVGAVAKLLMPGKDPGGIWITMALGIAGSIIATWLAQLDHLRTFFSFFAILFLVKLCVSFAVV